MIRLLALFLCLFIFSSYQISPSLLEPSLQNLIDEKRAAIDNGDYSLALEKAIAITEVYISEKKWTLAVQYLNNAIIYSEYSENYKDKSLVYKALGIVNQHLKDNNNYKAAIYQHYGEVLVEQEKYDSAKYYLNSALQIFSKTTEINWFESRANTMLVLAKVFFSEKKYDKAIDYLLEIEQQADKLDDAKYILDLTYNLLSVIYYEIQDLEKALHASLKAAHLIEQLDFLVYEDSLYLADIYQNLGTFYQTLQDNKRSKLYFETALLYYKQLNIPKNETIEALTNYGILFKMDKLPLAIEKLKQALSINHQFKNDNAYLSHSVWINKLLAETYEKSNHLDSAFYFTNQSLSDAVRLKNSDEIVTLQILKGKLHYLNDEFNTAQNLLIKNIPKISSKIPYRQRFDFHHAYNTLGKIYHHQGKYSEALQYFQKALVNSTPDITTDEDDISKIKNIYRIDHLIESLENKAMTLNAIATPQSIKSAHVHYTIALNWIEKMRKDFAFDDSKIFLNENSTRIYQKTLATAYQLYQMTNEEEYLDATFAIVEQQKSVLLLENLIGEQGKSVLGVPSDLREREQTLKSKLAYYQQKILDAKEDEALKKVYQGYFDEYQLAFAALKDSLSDLHQDYFELEYQNAITNIKTVQDKLLDKETAFIQFHALDSSWLVFLIEKDAKQLLSLPFGQIEQQQLNDLIAHISTRDFISKGNKAIQDFSTSSYQVYQSLFEPIIQQLSASTTALTIAANGQLNFLPFETLLKSPVGEGQSNFVNLPYLIKDYAFNYAYSASLQHQNRKTYESLHTNQQLLAFAPLYENPKNQAIASRGQLENLRNTTVALKGTGREIEAISNYFEGYFDGTKNATEAEFKSKVQDYGILHLAMHGINNPTSEKFSYLMFSNQPADHSDNSKSIDDNKLYQYEITNLNTKAQLAVLSACETGIGKYVEGEGMMSLGRSFMYAGVPSIVTSLWKLEDNATSDLIPLFYKYLAEGDDKSQALRKAKLEYLSNVFPIKAHPFYWSGLVTLGENQSLKESYSFWSTRNITILSVFLLVFFLSIFYKYKS